MTDAAPDFQPLAADEVAKAEAASTSAAQSRKKPNPIVPVPANALPMQYWHREHGEQSVAWEYHDAKGETVGFICRWNYTNSKGEPDKDIRPITFCDLGDGRTGWAAKGFPEPRPLYQLPQILARPDARVLVVEGEKAADAAARLFSDLVVTTPPHGALSPHKADWTPLKGRHVAVWPDNDEAGTKYAEGVTRLCTDSGAASVAIVPVPRDFPPKWDLADEPPEGWAVERLRELLDSASSLQTKEPVRSTPGWPYCLRADGVWRRVEREDRQSGEVTIDWVKFCSHLDVAAETRDSDGQNWGRLVVVTDRDATRHEWAMPMEMLAGSGEEYRRRLLSMGLELSPGRKPREWLHEYLCTAQPQEKARCVPRIGWHGQAFVLPDETLGDTRGERVLLQSVGVLDHAFRTSGTLEEWKSGVAHYAVGNSRLAFGLSAAFAAPLLHVAGAESGGIHLRGPSSIGKTTKLHVAGSVWGGGGLTGYIRQWRATDNGLEAVAQAHCDALLCLDELSQVDPRAAGNTAYMLANGMGKSRAGRGGEGRPPAEWRVLFLSSGEIGLAAKVAEDGRGRKLTAGQEVRVIDIPADAGAGLGLFETLHEFKDADAFARHLKSASSKFYGLPARVFIERVAANLDDAQRGLKGFCAEFLDEHCPPGADGQVSRVAQRFGLVAAAGELAVALGVLPWDAGEATRGAGTCFKAWLDARGGAEPAEITAAITQVRQFIERHGESRFSPWDMGSVESSRATVNRAGFRKPVNDGSFEYYILPQVWGSEVCQGLDPKTVARALADRGMLKPRSGGKPQYSAKLPGFGRSVSCYLLTPALFEEAGDA
jgi:uncharacterized protein (DUF927 family)